ncbi:MAG: xanthine dehydrogenase family protein subunit M [Proteobacteria bacterium]|nr:xanthine dehydrogenase family protein subunit M [Pseudomonadota bacterium]
MHNFNYHRPKTLSEARAIFSGAEDAVYLAGGQTLIPTLKQRLRQPSDVIDLSQLAELRGIAVEKDAVVIGAMTRHADVAASTDVRRLIPALAHLAGEVGDPQVRSLGTLGGSVANSDPAADYPAAVLALGAAIHTPERIIAADDFFTGLFETALEPGEMIVKISFPVPKRAAYMKFRNPASRYAVAGVCVADTAKGIRVAVTGAGPNAFRQTEMETALSKSFTPEALAGVIVSSEDLNTDLHATAAYRAHLVAVMARRAVEALI